MGIKFFGQYLLSKRIVTSEQLLQAIEYQQERNLRFGEHAVALGFASESDIERLNMEQRRSDERIGELGVRLGILTETQVGQILTRQRNDYVFIGEALVAKGFISQDELDRELAAFKEDQSSYRSEAIEVPGEFGAQQLVAPLVDLTEKFLLRVAGLRAIIGPGDLVAGLQVSDGDHFTRIDFTGDASLTYAFRATPEVALQIASKVAREDVDAEDSELLEDAIGEFCNIVCGNAAARFAQLGMSTDISPPDHSGRSIAAGQVLVYPLHLADRDVATAAVALFRSAG